MTATKWFEDNILSLGGVAEWKSHPRVTGVTVDQQVHSKKPVIFSTAEVTVQGKNETRTFKVHGHAFFGQAVTWRGVV